MNISLSIRAPLAGVVDWMNGVTGRRWLLRAIVLYVAIGCAAWIARPGDLAGYIRVGDLVLRHRDIYAESGGLNTWPPFFSLLCVPLALLARPTPYLARSVWVVVNLSCLLLVLHWCVRLAYGRSLTLRADVETAVSMAAPAALLPLMLSSRYISGNFEHLQVNIVVFALALGGLYLQRCGWQRSGSASLGCAIALKVMPVVFIPYLAFRRRWHAATYASVCAAACSLSPIGVFGWQRFKAYVAAWRNTVAAGWGVGAMNQSVFAMWDRFLGHGVIPLRQEGMSFLPASGVPLVTVATAGSVVIVVIAGCWSFRGPLVEDGDPRTPDWATLAEWSALFVASALFGPVCWKAYLVVSLAPYVLLCAAWRSRAVAATDRHRIGIVLLMSTVAGGLPSAGCVGRAMAERLEMASLPTLAMIVLLGGVLWFRKTRGAAGR